MVAFGATAAHRRLHPAYRLPGWSARPRNPDVVGYSRLMGADEEGTHGRFKAHLRELVDPKIREHHGRIVKTTGDGRIRQRC
jgi:hypothetical protein